MRACSGCRRRKIKCDAATTNTWPCSACIRLKLHCVPPTLNYDQEFASSGQGFDHERGDYESGVSGDDDFQHQISLQQQMTAQQKSMPSIYGQQLPYSDSAGVYQTGAYVDPSSSQSNMQYNTLHTPVSIIDQQQQYPPQNVFQTTHVQHQHSHPQSPDVYEQDQYGQQNLADLLGDLRMTESGTGRITVIVGNAI